MPNRHRASSMIHMYGLNYCADHTNGKIYEYSLDIYSDDGEPIIKQRDTAAIHGGLFGVPGQKLNFDEVEFIILNDTGEVAGTGAGPQPPLEGQYFTSWTYPLYAEDSLDLTTNGLSGQLWQKPYDYVDLTIEALSGTLTVTRAWTYYEDWPVIVDPDESLDLSLTATEGTLTVTRAFVYYEDWPVNVAEESLDLSISATTGTLTVVKEYLDYTNWPVNVADESLDLSIQAMYGTLTVV